MIDVLTGSFATPKWLLWPPRSLRVVDWNIERGLKFGRILEFLAAQDADVLTLQEVDISARRSGLRNVAEDLARGLQMYYAFGCEFQELAQGSRSLPAYTGQATLSRWPIRDARVINFRQQSRFWTPKWYRPNLALFQERLGGRIALFTKIDLPNRQLAVFNVHLESRGDDAMRLSQLKETFSAAECYAAQGAVIVAGDMNLDISEPGAAAMIRDAGFRDAVCLPRASTTPRKGLLNPGRSIDAILARNVPQSRDGRVYPRVHASDHYPVCCSLVLQHTGLFF